MMMMVLKIDDGDDNDGNCYDDGIFYNVIYDNHHIQSYE